MMIQFPPPRSRQPETAGLTLACPRSGAPMRVDRLTSAESCRRSLPPMPEDSYRIQLHLAPLPGSLFITDRDTAAPAHDLLVMSLPRAALDAFAQDHALAEAMTLRCPDGRKDQIALDLGTSLLPALASAQPPLFATHVVLALLAHLAQRYGELQPVRRRGGLSARQERIAKEMLLASIRNEAVAADIPRAVGLSRTYFIRAFRHSVGEPPHRWLIARRVDEARRLMLETDLPLTEIALACGFADQSHFTRIFSRHAGMPPGSWRRVHR